MAEKKLEIKVSGRDDGTAGKTVDSLADKLKRLKGAVGEESAFGGIFKIAAGVGAVAGLTQATRTLATAAEHAADLKEQFDKGDISAGKMFGEIAKSIPVLGDVVRAGTAIGTIFSDNAQSAAKVTQEAEAVNRAVVAGQAILKQSREEHEKTLDIVKKTRNEIALLGLEGTRLERKQLEQETESELSRIEKEAKDRRSKAAEAVKAGVGGKTLGLLTSELQDLRARLAAANRVADIAGGTAGEEPERVALELAGSVRAKEQEIAVIRSTQRAEERRIEAERLAQRSIALDRQEAKEQEITVREQKAFREKRAQQISQSLHTAAEVREIEQKQAADLREKFKAFGGKIAGGFGVAADLFSDFSDVGKANAYQKEIMRTGKRVGIFPQLATAFGGVRAPGFIEQTRFDASMAFGGASGFFRGLAGRGATDQQKAADAAAKYLPSLDKIEGFMREVRDLIRNRTQPQGDGLEPWY